VREPSDTMFGHVRPADQQKTAHAEALQLHQPPERDGKQLDDQK